MKQLANIAKERGTDLALVRQGGNHELWQIGEQMLTIPRHNEINELTAKSILRTAEGDRS